MDEVKLERGVAKGRFTRKSNVLRERLTKEDPPAALKGLYADVEDAFKVLEVKHDEYYALLLSSKSDPATLSEADAYILECEKIKSELNSLVTKKCGAGKHSSETTIKVKPLAPPVFSGEMRSYGTFKKDYMRLIVPMYGEDAYALKKCLTGDALSCVEGVEDKFEEMFRRLDNKYGNKCKLTESIVSELKNLKPVQEGDSKKLVHMTRVVERAWLDMEKIGLESEMETTSMVTLVERLLPNTLKRQWGLKAQTVDNPQEFFKNLLKFLITEREVCEYLESDLRSGSTKLASHSVTCDDPDNENVKDALHEIREIQGQQNIMITECLNTVSKLVSGLSSDSNNYRSVKKRCWYHGLEGHTIHDCYAFKNLSNTDKFSSLRNAGACFNCVNVGHLSKHCKFPLNTCDVIVNGKKCGMEHHKMLHWVLSRTANSSDVTSNSISRDGHLLMLSSLNCRDKKINVLWDSGSNVSLITHQKAKELGLQGKDMHITLTKVGNSTQTVSSKEYVVPLMDVDSVKWEITACGIDEITAPIDKVDMNVVTEIFPSLKRHSIQRPYGEVHLLVGVDYCNLLPQVVETNGNLQLMQNQFGYVLRGSHPRLDSHRCQSSVCVRINHVKVTQFDEITSIPKRTVKEDLDNYFSIENLGISCYPRCSGCKCGNCTPGQKNYTLKEERELAHITNGLSFNPEECRWVVSYPWLKDPNLLPNNVSLAIARLSATEKRLTRLGPAYCQAYQKQIEDMLFRGVARKLTKYEINDYEGPVFYIPHTEVLKPDSSSTPLRIVFNSSAKYMNTSLNDMWAKGPDILNSLLGILLRFRENKVAFTCDLAKMYNTIALSPLDQHCHRFLWRDLEFEKKFDHYILTRVPFGNRPSGTIAMLALKLTAEMSKNNYPSATRIIVNNIYVDDILGTCGDHETAGKLMKEIEWTVAQGGFKIKQWIISGDQSPVNCKINLADVDTEKVLGVVWEPNRDVFV